MKKLIFFISLLILSSGNLLSQLVIENSSHLSEYTWQKTYGSIHNDNAVEIINTLDNGFAIVGNAGLDISIVKLSGNGSVQWGKLINGINNDRAYSIIQTIDSCYILAGATNGLSYDYYQDMFLVKLNSNGELLWAKTFGTEGWDKACSIRQTIDNGYVVVGKCDLYQQEDGILIVKFGSEGNVEWSRFSEKTGRGLLYPVIIQTSDNGFAIATTINNVFNTFDMCFLKLDDFGRSQWSWVVGGNSVDEAVFVSQTSDRGYVLAGYTASYGAGAPDLYIVKLKAGGTIQWTRTIGGDNDDYAMSILKTNDGGFLIGGEGFSFGNGGLDFFTVKLDSNGRYLSGNTFGSPDIDYMRSIVPAYDGGYVVVGSTGPMNQNDFFIVKTDSLGRTCGSTPMTNPHIDSGGSILKYPLNMYDKPTALVSINATISDWGSMSILCLTGTELNSNIIPEIFNLHQNYPNPFNPVTKIKFDIPEQSNAKIIIYDLLGREITTLVNEQLKPGSYSVDWDGTGFASGVYFYSLITEGFVETNRMVLVK